MARCPAFPLLACWPYREVANRGDVVTQKPRFAIFDTRAPACTTHLPSLSRLDLHAHRKRICLGGKDREVYRLSPELNCAGQQLMHPAVTVQKMYLQRAPLVDPSSIPLFSVNECPPIRINDPGWQENESGAMTGYVEETGGLRRPRSESKLFGAFLVTPVIQ